MNHTQLKEIPSGIYHGLKKVGARTAIIWARLVFANAQIWRPSGRRLEHTAQASDPGSPSSTSRKFSFHRSSSTNLLTEVHLPLSLPSLALSFQALYHVVGSLFRLSAHPCSPWSTVLPILLHHTLDNDVTCIFSEDF